VELFPAIDVRDGKCVRLRQGHYADETVYGDNPAKVARAFVAAGASWVHTVDLDAARTGEPTNRAVIGALATAVRDSSGGRVKVQCGGGVRSVEAAEALFDAGVTRVVIGTAAVEEPSLVARLAQQHPNGVAVGLDVHDRGDQGYEVAVRGWTKGSGLGLFTVLSSLEDAGASAVIATEIGRDGMLNGPDVALYQLLLARTSLDVVASGGVGVLDDLYALSELSNEGGRKLTGVIVGKALYEGRFTVTEALAACRGR
jgi:phosphoribosylformimino-5-aminoimidazole carboxamide ribotide isomerase